MSDAAEKAPAVARAVRVLDLLGDALGEPLTLSELARGLGAAKSSTLNVISALEEGGLVRRSDTGYVLGRKVVELGGAYLRAFDPVLEFYRACADSEILRHERTQLAVLDGTHVIYVGAHVGRAPFRLSAGIGSRYPASITAVGNALLAELSNDEIARRFADDETRPAFTDRSTTSLDGLIAKIDATRERGYSLDHGEVYPGLAGFAVVVPPQSSGEVSLALGASLLESAFTDEVLAELLTELHIVGRRMSNPMNLATEALTGHIVT
ncbi:MULTISPECIES: IclR family transcriptional regulator [Leifsonia]|uniref:DNA-binding IclR family transcriptional regulator n=1 Tax=Leifsonia naganoensis TaxID=150025 RepID=A0A853DSI9_9MICO|nr:IclR family transcriptional regulator [Leifsonia naganoensis]NYK11177.1 DNA-binding IclR family transcriptional regulator [Leifsonia naganoensis]